MHGLILAGGEGSRLGQDVPKPMVCLGGKPLILHLIETMRGLGSGSLTCMVNADFPSAVAAARAAGARALECRTHSSLHTLVLGLQALPPGPVFCTMVDTVMPSADWEATWGASEVALAGGADAVLALTPYVDDERALYATVDADGRVTGLSGEPGEPVLVTGGVYAFSPAARLAAERARAAGRERMRGFLGDLVADARVQSVRVARIIDLDRPADLAQANAWLAQGGLGR